MSATTAIRINGLPAQAVETLKARAEGRGQSLAGYLRELILEEASLSEPAETMALIAQDEPIAYTPEDLREFMTDGRR